MFKKDKPTTLEPISEKDDVVVENEEQKTIVLTKSIKLIDDKFCKKECTGSCEALGLISNGSPKDGYKCNIFGEELFWRGNNNGLYKHEVLRCEECLRQEKENCNE